MGNLSALKMLEEKGLKPSYHRTRLLQFLLLNRIHPTVDEIYLNLHPEIPTLSRTTVYNTLKLFADNNLVLPLTIEDNELRYDIDTSSHGHFKCTNCGKVYDFSPPEVPDSPDLNGFKILQRHFYYRGICAICTKVKLSS